MKNIEIINKIKENKKIVYDNLIFYHITKKFLLKHSEILQHFRTITFDKMQRTYANANFYITFGEEA